MSPFKAENQRGQEGHSGPGLGPHTSDGGNLAYIVHTNKLFKKQLTVILPQMRSITFCKKTRFLKLFSNSCVRLLLNKNTIIIEV